MKMGSSLLVRRLHHQFKFDYIDSHYVYPDRFAALHLGRLLGLPVFVSALGGHEPVPILPLHSKHRPVDTGRGRWRHSRLYPLQEAIFEVG